MTKKQEIENKKNTATQDLSWVIIKPRITEKASITPEVSNAFVFEVSPDANVYQVKAAITEIYKVKPVKVNIAKIPLKEVSRRRSKGTKVGHKGGGKKAYVYLKKGDRIEFV